MDNYKYPMYKTQLLRLLPRWSMQALAKVITETLQAERALRFTYKTALVVDGLCIALHDAPLGGGLNANHSWRTL